LKRINRYLWGSGIVCGLEVDSKGMCIQVHPGAAMDCRGNFIEVCKCITIDFWEDCKKKYPEACVPTEAKAFSKYLVLRYAEIPADPQPVLSSNEDCPSDTGQTKCQASKIREGFCLELVDKCPKVEACPDDKEGPLAAYLTILGMSEKTKAQEEMPKIVPDCMKLSPPCPGCDCDDCGGCDECDICLARLEIDCGKKTVTVSCDCRRYIWSPRMLQWMVCAVLAKLDRHIDAIPASSEVAYQPMHSIWHAATELAVAQIRPKDVKMDEAVPAQMVPVKPKVKAKPTEEPKAKPTEEPKAKPTEEPKANPQS
jgi:hypothetical protein